MGMIRDIVIDGSRLTFTCELTTPACPVKEQIERDIRDTVARELPEVADLALTMTGKVRGANIPENDQAENLIPQAKHIIAVGAGKGGVGKSTCAINLALALKASGAKVALLDCDLYGPSIPIMAGIRDKPRLAGESRIHPLTAHGIELMSIGFLVDTHQAMLWRGPVLNGIVTQFLRDVIWGECDYMIVDLPPGTGDVALTLAQNCAVTGAVLVSTPQYVSIADVVRARTMFPSGARAGARHDREHVGILGSSDGQARRNLRQRRRGTRGGGDGHSVSWRDPAGPCHLPFGRQRHTSGRCGAGIGGGARVHVGGGEAGRADFDPRALGRRHFALHRNARRVIAFPPDTP